MAGQLHEEFLKGVKFLRENKVFEGLPPEEVRETKKRIKEVNDQILGLEKKLREYETKKALSLEEAELADIAQSVRDSSGKVKNTMMDFFTGVVRLGSTMPARVAGYGAHVVGAKETGKKLTQFAEDKDTAFEMVAPPAGADAGLVETIVSAGARSLAPSLMTGAVGAGVAGAIGKIPSVAAAIGGSAKLAGRIDTAARLFATTATMSADEVLRSSTKTDEMGGVVLPENALPVMAGTLAHAAIENVAGITPFKMISQTKFANKFLNREGVRAIRTGIKKLGLKGAIREFVKETAGEGAEEYLQGITEDVTAIFAHAPSITEAVQASYELIADWDYHKGKSREFVVGAGVGALYSGMFKARAVIENKHTSIEQKKEAMAMLESARAAREELGIVQQHLDTMMGARAEIARAELDDLQDRLRESGIKRYGDVQQLREELYNIVENGSRSEQPRDLEVYEGEAESVPYVEAGEVDAVWEDLIAELRAARDRAELEDKQLVPVEDVATKGEPTQGAELDRVEATQELGRIAAPEEKKLIGEPKRKLLAEPEVKAEAEAKPEPEAEPEAKPEPEAEPEVKAEQDAEKTDKLIRFIKDIISTNEALGNHKRNEEIKKKLAELELAKSGGTVEEGEVVARQVFGHPLATNIEGYQNLIPVKARDRGTIEGKIEQLQKHIDRLQTLWAYVDVVANGKMKPSKNPRYAFPQLKGLKTKKDFQRYKESADFGQVEVELNLLKTETRPELERMLKLFKKVEPEAKPEAKAEAEKAEPEAKAEAEAKPEPEAEPEVKPVEVEQHVADTIDGWKIERRKTFNKRQYKTFLEGETLGAHGKVSVTDDGGVTNSKFAIFGNATDPELFKLFKENTAFANPVPRKVLAGLQSKPINCTNFKYEYTENARGKNPVIVYSAEFEGERIYLRGNEHVYRYLKNRIPDLGIEAHAQREDATIAYFKDGKGEIVAMEVLMPERASEYQTSAKSISEALDGGYKKPESEKEFALKKAEREFLRAFRPSGRIGSILRTSPSGDITDGMFMIKGKYVPEEMRKAANSERYNDGDITDEEIGWITKNLEDGEHEPTVVGERKLPDSKDTEVVLKYQGTWNRPTAYASVLKPVLDYLGGLSEDTKMTVTPRGMLIFRSADGDLQAVAMTRSIEDATVGEGYADKVKERREQQEAEERELAKKRKELEQEEEAKARAEQERKRQDELAEEDKEYSGFLKGKTTLQRANAVKTLQLHGRKVYIDNLHRRGLLGIGTHEENKIKDPSRRTYNRWGWEQQQEHERRVREAGKKTVYEIRNTSTENLYREATKTEYEYAKHLLEQQKAESEVKAEPEDYSQDIDKEHARRAHSGTSFDPEKRGDSEVKGYNEQLQKVKTELLELAKTEEQKALAEEKFGQYRKKYKELFEAYLSSRSKVMSTMITGPANFPVARNKKANEAVDSKLKALQWFHEKFMRQAKKEIAPDASGRVSSDSPDAIEQLQKRLANREAAHEQMKKANAILRSKKLTDAEKIAKMQEAGVSEATAKGLLAGREYTGKVGFPPFALTNSNAEIKRIKDRIAELTKKQSQSTTETSFDGGKIVDNVEDNRLQIFYEGKPDSETIAKLKKSGFRWAPSKGAWQAYRNESSKRKAEAITGAKSIKLFSVEHAAAEATMMGYKLLKKGVTKFAEWARAMVKALGEKVKPILRRLYKELSNPTYSSKPRMGGISTKPVKIAEAKPDIVKVLSNIEKASFSEIEEVFKTKLIDKATLHRAASNPKAFGHVLSHPEVDLEIALKALRSVKGKTPSGTHLQVNPNILGSKEFVRAVAEALVEDHRAVTPQAAIIEYVAGFYQHPSNIEQSIAEGYGRYSSDLDAQAMAGGTRKARFVKKLLADKRTHPKLTEIAAGYHGYEKAVASSPNISAEALERLFGLDSSTRFMVELFSNAKVDEEFLSDLRYQFAGHDQPAVSLKVGEVSKEARRRGIKLYSVEQAVAEYSFKALKEGAVLLKKGVTKFAEWARAMVASLGEKVKPILRGLYRELQNPTYSSKPRMGAINREQKREQARKQVAEGKGLSQERLEGEPLQEWAERKIAAGQVMAEMDAADDAREAEIGKPVRAPSKSKVEAERKATEKRIEAEAKSTADIIMAAHKRTEKAAAEAKKALEKARAYIQEGKEREAKLTKAVEEATPKTIMDSWRKALDNAIDLLADQWAPIKRLQETVEKATGQKLTDEYNVYKLIETVQGRKSEHIKEAEGKYYDPIVNSLIKAKILLSDFNEYLYARAAFARNRMIAKRAGNPFALTGEPGSGMSDKEAQSIIDKVAKLPNAAEYAAIAEQVYALNNFLLDEQVRLGLITPQAREAYQKYEDYVPLKRPPEHGFILDRSALGRRSKASNHLEYINQAITATYTRAFNREVNQAVIKLFELTEQPLLYSKVKPKRVLVKGKNKDVIKVETEKFIGKDDYVWQRTGKKDYIVYKIHDEGLRNAIKGAKITDSIGSKILNIFATNNKWMAFVATGGNPEFLLKNPIRDIQQAMAYTATHISFSSAAKFPKHLAQASSILTEHNLTGKENELLRAFKLGGGLVGYSEFYSIEQQAKDLDKTIQKGIKGGVVYMSGEAVKKAVGVVAKWNSTLETMTRFAAYLNAKEAGLTELSALAHAKNVTVNFNKKGTMGHILNSLYVFAGANLGGNLNTAQILKKAMQTRKGQVMVAGAIALGAALEMINFNIAGEDDDGVNYYDKLPNYVKDLSYVFMLPGTKGKYIAIPMPYGLAMLPAFGRNMAAYYRGGQHVGKTVANLYSAFMDSFNPLGGDERGLLSDAVPSAIKPFFDVWSNTKWTGKRLRPEQDVFGSEVAISELTYPSDSKAAKEFAKWLNEVSGGDRYNSGWATYFSPGELDHLVLSYTGGLGKFLKRSADLLVKDKDEIELKEIPVSRVFYGEPGEYSTHQTFRENVELVRKYRRAVSEGDRIGMKKMKHLKKADDLLKDTERRIRHVRKVNKDQKKRDAYELALRKNFNKKMRNFNK